MEVVMDWIRAKPVDKIQQEPGITIQGLINIMQHNNNNKCKVKIMP